MHDDAYTQVLRARLRETIAALERTTRRDPIRNRLHDDINALRHAMATHIPAEVACNALMPEEYGTW